jgi:hypothetical protein
VGALVGTWGHNDHLVDLACLFYVLAEGEELGSNILRVAQRSPANCGENAAGARPREVARQSRLGRSERALEDRCLREDLLIPAHSSVSADLNCK